MFVGDTVSFRLDSGTTWGKLLKPSKAKRFSNIAKKSYCNEMHFGKIQGIQNQP